MLEMIFQPFKFYQINRSESFFRFGRIIIQAIRGYRVRWPGGPPFKASPAIWTNILQNICNTSQAIGTFKTTDHCFIAIIWQVFPAVLANGSYFQHKKNINDNDLLNSGQVPESANSKILLLSWTGIIPFSCG